MAVSNVEAVARLRLEQGLNHSSGERYSSEKIGMNDGMTGIEKYVWHLAEQVLVRCRKMIVFVRSV
jgi:hypothetical protein